MKILGRSSFDASSVAGMTKQMAYGAVGALLVWAIRGQLSETGLLWTLGVFVTTGGWLVNAHLNRRNNDRLLKFNIRNEARLKLVDAIRREQEWINKLCYLGEGIQARKTAFFATSPTVEAVHQFRSQETARAWATLDAEHVGRRPLILLLGEYEVVFPETRRLRQQFEIKRGKLADYFRNWIVKMNSADTWDQGASGLVVTTIERDYALVLWDLLGVCAAETGRPVRT